VWRLHAGDDPTHSMMSLQMLLWDRGHDVVSELPLHDVEDEKLVARGHGDEPERMRAAAVWFLRERDRRRRAEGK